MLVLLETIPAHAAIDDVNVGDIEYQFNHAIGFRLDAASLGGVISAVLPYMFMIAGVGVLFFLIYGGYQMMVSQGNEKTMEEARGKITNAIIGFIVIFVAFWIMQALGVIFGLQGFGGIF